MAQQRKKRNSRVKEKKASLPWGPMFLSFAVGAFIMFLIHLNDNVEPEKVAAKKPEVKKEQKKSTAVEPTFEFYSLLPEMEVVVDKPKSPKRQIVTAPAVKDKKSTAKSADKTRYMLQVGSFKSAADADAHRAKLAFLGIESKVQTVTIDNKDTWHRVQVGPIVGRTKADEIKKRLESNNLDSLLVRTKS